ncbi:ribose-phosphate diphosphokinase [Corynebacterium caspium]|uniref:ribose-phosphate diphosphokinase n=1 Tax=Corynebacterium caspium TaxID=234828 RepID=UPI0003771B44|nr:ribose-phosphate diphosphokinase [Corynebacterium caspium]WKD59582.1 Ribose-phosphate pyrophosphokinase [Corynebacterium caspium DSM 44850]
MVAHWKQTHKNMMLFSGRAHPELADQVSQELGIELTPTTARDFANGEIFVRFEESVRGSDCFVIQSHTQPMNQWLMEQLIMIDALKRGSARTITAILPFYPYARQDKKHRGREPISARLVADLLTTAGADRIVSVDLHTDQIQGFFDGPVDHMHAMPILTDYIKNKYDLENICVVSPDAGRVKTAEKWANILGDAPLAFVHKTRSVDIANHVVANRVVGEVAGKNCVLLDDMIDTGGTIAGAAKVLYEAGAKSVLIACTHGVFSPPARERLLSCGAEEIITTNTLPQDTTGWEGKLTVLSLAPLLARTINEIFENGSVTTLFEGQA